MSRKLIISLSIVFVVCLALTAVSYADGESAGCKAKSFWQKLFNYPANVTKESVNVVADTSKRGTAIVTEEVKTVGQVTSGSVTKAGDLVIMPVKEAADTTAKAVEGTVNVPSVAAND